MSDLKYENYNNFDIKNKLHLLREDTMDLFVVLLFFTRGVLLVSVSCNIIPHITMNYLMAKR